MCYNQYLYQLSGSIVPIIDVVKMSLSVANVLFVSIPEQKLIQQTKIRQICKAIKLSKIVLVYMSM